MGWYDGHGVWGWGGWLVMAVAMLGLWSILLAAVVVIVRAWRGDSAVTRSGAAREPDDALRLLDERFARGEIDADEYTRRRDLLRRR